MSSENDVVLSVENVSKCFEMYEKPVHRLYQTLCAGKRMFYREFWALRDISIGSMRGHIHLVWDDLAIQLHGDSESRSDGVFHCPTKQEIAYA